MGDITKFFLVDLFPVLIPVAAVGFKIYHDLGHLKITVIEGFKGVSEEMHTMNTNISELQIQIVKNSTADEYRDKALDRLDREIIRLNNKLNNK